MRVIGMKTAGKHFDHPVELFYLFWKPITKHFSLWDLFFKMSKRCDSDNLEPFTFFHIDTNSKKN